MTETMPGPAEKNAHAVTGAFGFSGKYLARRLLDAGERVVTLTNSPQRPDPFAGAVEARPLDFGDVKALSASLADVSVLYNTYWVRFKHPRFSYTQAVRNTLTLLEAARAAGVERVVHVSIANADTESPWDYFSAKGHLEKALAASGLNYAVLRPAVLFGPEDILINNIAWALRRFPVFGLFGDGEYFIRPIHVDDMAALMAEQGKSREIATVNALGPEDLRYKDIVALIADALGKKRRYVRLSPKAALMACKAIGLLVDDVFVSEDEITALMAGMLHVPGAEAAGGAALSTWVREQSADIGRVYHAEMDRRTDRSKAY
ncbi:MAG: NAD(P)H-binding protein [Desulfovibrio sp.]|jgi:NADH dehydrogenase|nr:NAD(P)H-binding protein [Desulfovibrio sp.]